MDEEYGNLPDGFFLSQSEIEDLRKSKKELTDYGKEKLKKLMNEEAERKALEAVDKLYRENGDALKRLAEIERQEMLEIAVEREAEPFYRFFVIDYYGTGNGRSIYLQISLNNHNDEHYEKEWKHFVNYEYYLQGAEELTEREFLDRYTRLLPNMTVHMLREKSLTIFQTHLHFNRS